MNKKEAQELIIGLGIMKFKLLADNTIYYETIQPIKGYEDIINIEVSFYIKEDEMPTVFCYHEFCNLDFEDLQIQEIIEIKSDGNERKLVYFSRYEE